MESLEPKFLEKPCTAFCGLRAVASGALVDVALAVKAQEGAPDAEPVLVFDDANGAVVELDLRGSTAEMVARLTERARHEASGARRLKPPDPGSPPQGRGRPKLGVVAREVTLLPRHWEWLAEQPGGASGALRRLVEAARRTDGGQTARRQGKEAAYRFLSTVAGNLAGFEEAMRALFADDWRRFGERTAAWPEGIPTYARKLAGVAAEAPEEG